MQQTRVDGLSKVEGEALVTRFPSIEPGNLDYQTRDIVALVARVVIEERTVDFYGTHLHMSRGDDSLHLFQVQQLDGALQRTRAKLWPRQAPRSQFVPPSGGEGRTVGTLDRAAGILIRLVQRPRLFEVGGVEASGKQLQTGASRSRAWFAPAPLAQEVGETDAAAHLEPRCPRPTAPSGRLRSSPRHWQSHGRSGPDQALSGADRRTHNHVLLVGDMRSSP